MTDDEKAEIQNYLIAVEGFLDRGRVLVSDTLWLVAKVRELAGLPTPSKATREEAVFEALDEYEFPPGVRVVGEAHTEKFTIAEMVDATGATVFDELEGLIPAGSDGKGLFD